MFPSLIRLSFALPSITFIQCLVGVPQQLLLLTANFSLTGITAGEYRQTMLTGYASERLLQGITGFGHTDHITRHSLCRYSSFLRGRVQCKARVTGGLAVTVLITGTPTRTLTRITRNGAYFGHTSGGSFSNRT